MYGKLAGMTGTADTEAFEFQQIYGLDVVVIPTHRPMVRKDRTTKVYLTQKEKFDAVIEDIRDCVTSAASRCWSARPRSRPPSCCPAAQEGGIEHQVLNAKQHEREAQIVAQAGRPGMVTIATNMAGRGTDIVLGGNLEAEIAAVRADATLDPAQRETRIAALRGLAEACTTR
jgi:preprotein translocase subunit SecA